MIAMSAYRETISSEDDFSLFDSEKDSFNFEMEKQLAYILGGKLNANEKNQQASSKKPDFSKLNLVNSQNQDLSTKIRTNFLKFSWFAFSVGLFVSIGNLSKRYC